MSHKEGAYLGGIRTVEDIRLRCRIDQETGCWHWGLAIVQGAPVVNFVLDGKKRKCKGRRAALLLSGKEIKPGHHAFAKACCKSDDCVNPEHARSGDREAAGKALARSGRIKGLPTKSIGSRKGWDGRRKITPEMAAEIRASSESVAKLSERLGVSTYAIWSCRAGKSHRQPVVSVFDFRPELVAA